MALPGMGLVRKLDILSSFERVWDFSLQYERLGGVDIWAQSSVLWALSCALKGV